MSVNDLYLNNKFDGYYIDTTNTPQFNELKTRIEAIEHRLAILIPNEQLQERYPALKEAYDHYKLIEGLISGNEQT